MSSSRAHSSILPIQVETRLFVCELFLPAAFFFEVFLFIVFPSLDLFAAAARDALIAIVSPSFFSQSCSSSLSTTSGRRSRVSLTTQTIRFAPLAAQARDA